MIIHKLILQHLKSGDDASFYLLQAEDAIEWIEKQGVIFSKDLRALDLGCGHGILGARLMRRGCRVTFADESNLLNPDLKSMDFKMINLDRDPIESLGVYDLIICSNVYEHLAKPAEFLASIGRILSPGGTLYLSWTNWLSPWGGHEFSPFHYLGPKLGPKAYDWLTGKQRLHTPFQNLFPTYIGQTLKWVRQVPGLEVMAVVPRYYPELRLLMRVPLLREFLAWNCAVLIKKH